MRGRSVAIVCGIVLLAFSASASAQLLGGGIRQRLEGMRDRATLKDSDVHYDPSVLTVGNSRQQVVAAFGQPNATQGEGPSREDVYAFYPDGSKFVDPQVSAGTIAAAVFTAGISLAARQAKIMIKEKQITCYRVHYDANNNILSVQVVPPEMG
ncbi:MAG TPA: hypothetical protein VMH37_11980, partial [Candidatus Binataceae bacterium]|nr:hypothetical protein [Candidatus Binataceae bacterium]